MPRPNWFIAFPLGGAFVLGLPPVPRHFRRFHPDDVHLTLAFLGGCGEVLARAAFDAFDARLAQHPFGPLDVSLGQVVPMGPPGRYTALSALLEEGRSQASVCITEWRDTLTDAAAARRDPRPAKPHVSLARPSARAALADREAGLEWAARVDVRAVRARLDRVALYTWWVPRDERLFHIVAERRLG